LDFIPLLIGVLLVAHPETANVKAVSTTTAANRAMLRFLDM